MGRSASLHAINLTGIFSILVKKRGSHDEPVVAVKLKACDRLTPPIILHPQLQKKRATIVRSTMTPEHAYHTSPGNTGCWS